ncbi:MAG TPA: histidine kinase dimerization/phospho-acceptor domain-containing protein, partial [Terriglobales bacterium]|nr:histidine kinase dimerization/phospho-acceptor domain-containing protein [Terriglobales bacterium]
MRTRIFFKLLGAFLLVIAAATLILDFSVRSAWEDSLYQEIHTSLSQKVRLFAATVEHERDRRPLPQIAEQAAQAADARATIIDSAGKVLADTRANPAEMENHATRPEFIAALHGQMGSATRTSHTVGIPFLYVAAPVPGGAVRLAYPLASIQELTWHVRVRLLWASGLALVIATLLAAGIAQSISLRLRRIVTFAERVASGDLTARIAETSSDEVAHVASALDKTARRLEESFAAVETARQQLETVLNSMQEAVLAVDAERRVLWANGRMHELARVSPRSPLVTTVRDPDFLACIEEVLGRSEVRSARASSLLPGRSFQVTAAPMPGGGAVAVVHDLTEIERVEKTRRDFIANVSHELRTPLTSIQGYAETLLEGGTADSAAARDFLEIIRKNATRMSRLTEDLLTLARVESGEQEFALRPVAAADLLRDAQESFRAIARAAGVELSVEDTATREVAADIDALHQVFANLIDNALKYGASGGRVVLAARDSAGGVEFSVRDF